MEHIRQFDWCYSQPDYYFIKEDDIANSATERILRNKFRDPLISSDSDDEKPNINWNEVFSNTQNNKRISRYYVPGMHPIPPYPKVSALTRQQHYQCLKVLCSQNDPVLELEFMPRPTKSDYRLFEDLKDIYEKEQKEYIEWAKTLWTNGHCIRALRPKPPVETVYEARFKMRTTELQSYPKKYGLAAQIPLETDNICDFVLVKALINVNVKELPVIKLDLTSRLTIMKHCAVPEPCNRHPCRFILPMETSVSELPLTEIQRELAQYAVDNDAQFIASESALRCLVELDQPWLITVNVCSVFGLDGATYNVVVLGSDFSTTREPVLIRTYRSFKHLLEYALVPTSEKKKFMNNATHYDERDARTAQAPADDVSSDDDDAQLLIDESAMQVDSEIEDSEAPEQQKEIDKQNKKEQAVDKQKKSQPPEKQKNKSEFYSCSCKDTFFERPPPRSYKKWQIRSKTTGENLDVIVHCPHKVRDDDGEVILEPVPEYQLDLGATAATPDHLRVLALALRLRPDAALLTVRIDNASGELVKCERAKGELTPQKILDSEAAISARLHAALVQLRGLRPDHYVLRHEPSHGTNAMLYVAKLAGTDLELHFDSLQPPEGDEARDVRRPPTLCAALLPVHKYRKILPCAFSYYENQVQPPRGPPSRNKAPPQALKWPKRKKKGKAKN